MRIDLQEVYRRYHVNRQIRAIAELDEFGLTEMIRHMNSKIDELEETIRALRENQKNDYL